MKFPIISTAIVTLAALTATAQAELKIVSVNVQELYTKFYKRFDTETTLQKHLAEIKADIKTREDKLRALQAFRLCRSQAPRAVPGQGKRTQGR